MFTSSSSPLSRLRRESKASEAIGGALLDLAGTPHSGTHFNLNFGCEGSGFRTRIRAAVSPHSHSPGRANAESFSSRVLVRLRRIRRRSKIGGCSLCFHPRILAFGSKTEA
jgi:hypothetical protein